jgi:pimeloyl-ACP methyl ester carboxylesterase
MPMINVDGISLHYIVQGTGTPIIFIHPPVLSSTIFKYQLEQLSKFFMVIAFDIRGHGKSQPSPTPLTYKLIVEDMKQLIIYLGVEKVFICGYSAGGSIALEFLLTYPALAYGAVLIGGISEVSDWCLRSLISLGRTLAKTGAISTIALSAAWSHSDTRKLFWKLFRDAKSANAKNVEEYYQSCLNYNCTNQLQKIDLPVLLIYGGRDKIFHKYGNILHSMLSYSELDFIPNILHQIPTKAKNELNNLIKQFLYTHKSLEEETTPFLPMDESSIEDLIQL